MKTPQQIAEDIVGELTPAPAELKRKIAWAIQCERDAAADLTMDLEHAREEIEKLKARVANG
jgi:hypothetical protein